MSEANLKAIIEALLLASESPLSVKQLMRLLAHDPKNDEEVAQLKKPIQSALKEIEEELSHEGHGIQLIVVDGAYQLRTKAPFAEWILKLNAPKPTRLSAPAIETLAIVAYRQPVTRGDIEDIRSVDSGAVLKGLLERSLVRIVGRKDEPGRPLLYGTSPEFMEIFGLKDLKELPPVKELEQKAEELLRQSAAGDLEEGGLDLQALEVDPADLEWLDAKERETFEELNDSLKVLKEKDLEAKEIIAPETPEEAAAEAPANTEAVEPSTEEPKSESAPQAS